MKNKLLILLLFIADAYLKELKIPISPCPDIFHYAYDGTEVYGIFNFEGAELNKSYNLQLHMVYEDTVYIVSAQIFKKIYINKDNFLERKGKIVTN